MIGIMRHPRASALNAVFSSDLRSTRIVFPSIIVGRRISCPSSSIPSAIVHSSHPADALPSSSLDPSDAASMVRPSRILISSISNPSLSGGKSASKRLKVCCCIVSSATTRCIFAFTNVLKFSKVYCRMLGLIIILASLLFCGSSNSGRLLCSANRVVPRC